MKQIVIAIWSILCCLSSEAAPVSESNILGTYTLTPLGSVSIEIENLMPKYITFLPDYSVDFVFDGDGPSVVGQCDTNWTLTHSTLRTSLDCASIFPSATSILEMNLKDITGEMLDQEKGFEVHAIFNGLPEAHSTWSGKVILKKVPQGHLDINNLSIRSGDGAGLTRRETENGCCLNDACDYSMPCRDVELDYSNGRIILRLVFDKNIENLDSVDLFQKHLNRIHLTIGFK